MVDTKGNPIVVHENHNELMEEVFRSVRTNIQYMLQEGQKVILFTSTSSGEGKVLRPEIWHAVLLSWVKSCHCRTGYPQARFE